MNQKVVKQIVVGIAALVLMVLFSACAGVGTTTTPGGVTSLTGSVVSVDLNNHTVTINVNGQTRTISNVPSDVLTTLQSQIGKVYGFQLTQNSDGSYSIESGTNVTPEANETSSNNETPGVNEPGSIEFIGNVTSSSNGNIVVSMPDGSSLTASTAGADLGDFNGSVPGAGTHVKVEANANADGSFTATKIGNVDSSDDVNQVTFQGVTTQAGSAGVIHFTVGNKSYSFTIPSTVDLSDFGGNAQSIASGTTVKVTVEYSGTTGTVTKVSS